MEITGDNPAVCPVVQAHEHKFALVLFVIFFALTNH